MLIKGPAFVIWLDEFNLYHMAEFENMEKADEFILDLIGSPKNRLVFKNFSGIDKRWLTDTIPKPGEEEIK